MPDQFGNPLPGENLLSNLSPADAAQAQQLGLINPPAQPAVGTAMSPADLAREQQLVAERPDTNIDPYGLLPKQGAAPVAPPAQPAAPPQFVSKPGTPAAQTNPLEVVGYVPGGTSTTVGRTDLGEAGKKAEAALGEAGQAKVEAGKQFAAIQQEKADAGALAAAQRGDAAAKADSAIQLHNAKQQQDIAANIADRKRDSDDYARMAADLGPDHFWQVQSTGQKIGNILAIAMSGIGNAFSAKAGINARNGALDLINAAIDRDIDMQKTALAAKERGIRTKESLYQDLRSKGADELSALEFAKAAANEQVSRQFDTAIAKAGTKEAAANLADLQANVKQQQAEHLQRAAEMTAKHVQSTSSSTPVTAMQLQQMQAQNAAAQQAAERKAQGLVERNPAMDVEGFGQATDPESKRELVKAKLQFDPAERALKVMERLSRQTVLSPSDADLWNTASAEYAGFIKGDYAQKLGQVTSADEKFLSPLVPTRGGYAIATGGDKKILAQVKDAFETRRRALKGYTVRTQ